MRQRLVFIVIVLGSSLLGCADITSPTDPVDTTQCDQTPAHQQIDCVAPTSQPVKTPSTFAQTLETNILAIIGALLLVAGYLREQSGKAAASRQRLFAEHAWLQRVDDQLPDAQSTIAVGQLTFDKNEIATFRGSIVRKLKNRRRRYSGLALGELVTLVFVLILVLYFCSDASGWEWGLAGLMLLIVSVLTAMHLALWVNTGFGASKWESSRTITDDATSKTIIPIAPEGLAG